MKLFPILQLYLPSLAPSGCKIHLAVPHQATRPIDEFLAGTFDEWQRWQGARNFGRPYIVSLIKLDGTSRWLFAGVHATKGYQHVKDSNLYYYTTTEIPTTEPLTGRIVVTFERSGRQSYLKAEKWADMLTVHEFRPQRMTVEDFPGFTHIILPKAKLDLIVHQQIASWKAALSSVAGIYLIADTETGRHYVGSAYGQGGIWQRWVEYSETGHGNNKALIELLAKEGQEYSAKFQFSVLETADTNATKDDLLARETHWKDALCSRESFGGYNAN